MQKASENSKLEGQERQAANHQAEATMRALVKLLARQAAEEDFEAFMKSWEAANDN